MIKLLSKVEQLITGASDVTFLRKVQVTSF